MKALGIGAWCERLLILSLLCMGTIGACAGSGAADVRSAAYGAMADGGQTIAAVPLSQIPGRYRRQEVRYPTAEAPGTVVVDLSKRYLYVVLSDRRALRYGIGTGKAAYIWRGEAVVGRKSKWPRWTPTEDMVRRAPRTARYRDGVDPGVFNPLGARALYLYQGGRDTLYRIHGTAEWWSIGDASSAGCIRMLNQDVIDLYARVPVGAKVIVEGDGTMPGMVLRR